jgi:hypothetical protein
MKDAGESSLKVTKNIALSDELEFSYSSADTRSSVYFPFADQQAYWIFGK